MVSTIDPNLDLATRLRSAGAKLLEVQHALSQTEPAVLANGELSETVRATLDNPCDFPPLARCTVPGDQVAIAVDEAVPRLAEIVTGTVTAFVHAGIETEAIRVITAEAECAELLRADLQQFDHGDLSIVLHDPADENELCYVGVMQNGKPLLMNRTLFEADVVFPIGCARLDEVLGTAGIYDSLYPRFADAETVRRWRRPESVVNEHQAVWQRDADEAGWLLGAAMILEVVPGRRGNVAGIVAGEAGAVARESREQCRRLWSGHVEQPATLAIVTLEGNGHTQSWENLARAVNAASMVLQENGALAICCQRLAPPGKSLRRLATTDDRDDVLRQLTKDAEADTWSAWQLALAQQRGPVYLLGGLDADAIEELGIAPVSDVAELARLASRHEACVLLEDSHQLVTTTGG